MNDHSSRRAKLMEKAEQLVCFVNVFFFFVLSYLEYLGSLLGYCNGPTNTNCSSLQGVQVEGKYREMEGLRREEESLKQKILEAKEDLTAAEQDLENLPRYEPPKEEIVSYK